MHCYICLIALYLIVQIFGCYLYFVIYTIVRHTLFSVCMTQCFLFVYLRRLQRSILQICCHALNFQISGCWKHVLRLCHNFSSPNNFVCYLAVKSVALKNYSILHSSTNVQGVLVLLTWKGNAVTTPNPSAPLYLRLEAGKGLFIMYHICTWSGGSWSTDIHVTTFALSMLKIESIG